MTGGWVKWLEKIYKLFLNQITDLLYNYSLINKLLKSGKSLIFGDFFFSIGVVICFSAKGPRRARC